MSYNMPSSRSEYEQQVNNVKQRIQAAGSDLPIYQDPASVGWLTGFDDRPLYTPQAALLHLIEQES